MGETDSALEVSCCIAGGGPAGMMLGYLLARAGVPVVVLEKHNDFLRDFRGDTIHPSTLEVMHELGMLDAFLQRPHQRLTEVRVLIGDRLLLHRVQRRRMFPTRVTQGLQLLIQNRVFGRVLGSDAAVNVPWPVMLVQRWAVLRRIPARVIGIGVRPEHVAGSLD